MAGKHDRVKDENRYSILVKQLDKCYICGTSSGVALHEVFYGTANRKKSKEDGMVIPLCGVHHNMSGVGVHYNKELDLRLKQYAQRVWMKYYNKTEEDFIDRFGQNYL